MTDTADGHWHDYRHLSHGNVRLARSGSVLCGYRHGGSFASHRSAAARVGSVAELPFGSAAD